MALIIVLPLNMINYILPIFASYILSTDHTKWITGYFPTIDFLIFPQWVGIVMVVSACLATFAQLAGDMLVLSWTMWTMSKGRKDDVSTQRYLPYFVSWSWIEAKSQTVRPVFAILINAVLALLVSALPFNFLVQVYLILHVTNITCTYAALVRFKYSHPEFIRPFEIPGGKIGALMLCVLPLAVAVTAVARMDWLVIVTGVGTVAGVGVCYPIKKFWVWLTRKIYVILSRTVMA